MTLDGAHATEEVAELKVDVAIVGAGPCGLYATYYAGFRGLSVAVIDALEVPGGQMAAMYPEKLVYDIAGYPAVKAQDLIDNLVEQASLGKPTYLLGHRAQTLGKTADGVVVETDLGAIVSAKAVVIAGGIGGFTPRRLPEGARFEGRGLRYFVPRLTELAGRDVVVVGGGDSALDWALSLEPLARSVTLVHRRNQFRAHEHSVTLLRDSTVRTLTPYAVSAIHGEDRIAEVELLETRTNEHLTVPADEVVAALGFLANLGPLAHWGLELSKRHIVVDRTMQTSVERVYAVGDIADYEGKVKLIAVGFGEAALAVNNLVPWIDPELSVVPGHSSDAI
ncbi:NAD(P)/FAD-dependent oxidoreductase [Haloechinothrix salitolerans]|uniref:Ferredoxin--NADP reductase n=1 Tax=Haloechinothrix salitolerans TaxID=926830 RepID=A0ABW2C5Y6_9PSEU